MPSALAVALVALAVEVLRTYRAKYQKRRADEQDPDNGHECPRCEVNGSAGDGTRWD